MKRLVVLIALLTAPVALNVTAANAIPCWDGIADACSEAPAGYYDCKLTQSRCPAS